CDREPGDDGNERQKIVFAAFGAGHSFKKLPAIEDSNSVEKHDQAGQADRSGDLGLRGEGSNGQAYEQDGADAEREASDVDLADDVTDADGEKQGQNRLRTDDVARHLKHDNVSDYEQASSQSARGAGRGSKLFDPPIYKVGRGRLRVRMLVIKLHRLPFERAKLMERLHLDPLDILHRGDEPGDLIDVGGIIGESRHQREAHP